MDSRATERMKRLAVGGRGWRTGEHACFGVWPAGMSWAVQSSNRPDFALVSPTRALTCWPGLPLYSIGLAPVPQREFCPSGNKPFGGGSSCAAAHCSHVCYRLLFIKAVVRVG